MTETPAPVRVVQQFDAPPGGVWRAWTDPRYVGSWWGSDPKATVIEAALDVRPGGRFAITFRDPDGSGHTCSGVYAQVEPLCRLAFTWVWQSVPETESFVKVTLVPVGRATRAYLEHTGLSRASVHDCERCWRGAFDKLQRLVEGRGG
jgi:uncharacterized protein YndB with AHSA1/START domain